MCEDNKKLLGDRKYTKQNMGNELQYNITQSEIETTKPCE